jgi:hypothetical protein
VDFVSNWAILNDTKLKQLERILQEFYHLSQDEIDQAAILLESYHAVYRRDRLQWRRLQMASGQTKIEQPCLPPSESQLQEIARRVNIKSSASLEAEAVGIELLILGDRLGQYCSYIRGKFKLTAAMEGFRNHAKPDHFQSHDSINPLSHQDEPPEFIMMPYHSTQHQHQWCA